MLNPDGDYLDLSDDDDLRLPFYTPEQQGEQVLPPKAQQEPVLAPALPEVITIPDDSDPHEEVLDAIPAPPAAEPAPDPEDEMLTAILEAFPEASMQFVRNALRRFEPASAVERVFDLMLNHGYEKAPKPDEAQEEGGAGVGEGRLSGAAGDSTRDFTQTGPAMSSQYTEAVLAYLKSQFINMSVGTIKSAMRRCNNHLFQSMELLQRSVRVNEGDAACVSDGQSFIHVRYNKVPRAGAQEPEWVPGNADSEFISELVWIRTKDAGAQEAEDHKLAERLNEEMYEEEGQSIDCGCCFSSYPFEQMCQCTDGHLFCVECLRHFAQERLFGENRTDLKCMATEEKCEASFPRSQLRIAMTEKMWEKYEELEQEQAVTGADMDDLVECPFCSFKAVVENPDDKVFKCLKCHKESCRLCHEPSHIPLRCEEVEKKTETSLRLHIEKKMTEALLRECPKCHAKFFKSEGCNKMTCSCGHIICYVCRESIPRTVGYNHFCPHHRGIVDGFGKCEKPSCGKCFLWSRDSKKADDKAVEEERVQAEEEYKAEHTDAAEVQVKAPIGGDDAALRRGIKRKEQDDYALLMLHGRGGRGGRGRGRGRGRQAKVRRRVEVPR